MDFNNEMDWELTKASETSLMFTDEAFLFKDQWIRNLKKRLSIILSKSRAHNKAKTIERIKFKQILSPVYGCKIYKILQNFTNGDGTALR